MKSRAAALASELSPGAGSSSALGEPASAASAWGRAVVLLKAGSVHAVYSYFEDILGSTEPLSSWGGPPCSVETGPFRRINPWHKKDLPLAHTRQSVGHASSMRRPRQPAARARHVRAVCAHQGGTGRSTRWLVDAFRTWVRGRHSSGRGRREPSGRLAAGVGQAPAGAAAQTRRVAARRH